MQVTIPIYKASNLYWYVNIDLKWVTIYVETGDLPGMDNTVWSFTVFLNSFKDLFAVASALSRANVDHLESSSEFIGSQQIDFSLHDVEKIVGDINTLHFISKDSLVDVQPYGVPEGSENMFAGLNINLVEGDENE
jgi:hypothetical protein